MSQPLSGKKKQSTLERDFAADVGFCLNTLAHHEKAIETDPMTNSVRQLSHELLLREDDGSIDIARMKALVAHFAGQALDDRIDALVKARETSEKSPSVFTAVHLKASTFNALKDAIETPLAGIVFTAHPTFAMTGAMRRSVAQKATARLEGKPEPDVRLDLSSERGTISLAQEHASAQEALALAKEALGDLYRSILADAQKRFPDQWVNLRPNLVSIASWVGYDLDGRTDIHWSETLRLRLQEKADQLAEYAMRLQGLATLLDHEQLRDIADQLSAAETLTKEQAFAFKGAIDTPEGLSRAANLLTEDHPDRLISLAGVVADIDQVLKANAQKPAAIDLAVLRSEMVAYGLGRSRIHMRINAAQIRSALREDLGLSADDDFMGRTTSSRLSELAKKAKPVQINTATVFQEQMTARRQFMLVAQILKHIDEETPIRFLIAESETPAIILGALYLARTFDVAHRVDISPLFETPSALESGGRFLRQLLKDPIYIDAIRQRGVMAIQIGFSDSGRFMGQVGANLAIERLQSHLARHLVERDVRDVDIIIFNTHGESMGRGAFPASLAERFDYLITPWARSLFQNNDLALITESSFQGGDGYLHFGTKLLAQTTLYGLLGWRLSDPKPQKEDSFYKKADFSWDIYRALLSWQKDLFEDDGYHMMIGAFAPNLLPVTGSRKARRQSGSTVVGPRALRAIPHNAILQQLAMPINVVGGLGAASVGRVEDVVRHARKSERFSQALGMAREARRLTSLPVLRAYAILYDPSFWASKSAASSNPAISRASALLAEQLEKTETANGMRRAANRFAIDLNRFDEIMMGVYGREEDQKRYAFRRSLHAIQAIRQTYIMRGFLMAATVPSISPRHDLGQDWVFSMAFSLRFGELADQLAEIFPASEPANGIGDGLTEPADIGIIQPQGYPALHRDLIEPLRDLQDAIITTTVSLAHYYSAFG